MTAVRFACCAFALSLGVAVSAPARIPREKEWTPPFVRSQDRACYCLDNKTGKQDCSLATEGTHLFLTTRPRAEGAASRRWWRSGSNDVSGAPRMCQHP